MRGEFRLFLPQTSWAHAVRGLGIEFRIEKLFHLQPLAVVINLPAPTANVQKTFQVMQSLKQPPRCIVHPKPNANDDDCPEEGAMPIRCEVFAENQVRKSEHFREPGKHNEQ